MTLTLDMAKFVEAAKGRIDDLNREAVLFAARGVILRSPVGNPELWAANAEVMAQRSAYQSQAFTYNQANPGRRRMGTSRATVHKKFPLVVGKGYVGGRFRANWQFGYGSVNATTTEVTDAQGDDTLGRISAEVAEVEAGSVCYVTNSLPYAYRLEYEGWSKQAPAGMVRITFAEIGRHLQAYISSLPR